MTIILNGTTGITTPADTVTTITSPAATALTIQSAGVTAITVDTAQNVGIGTTSPQGKLHVSGGYAGFQHNSGGTYPAYNTYFGAIGTNFQNGSSYLDFWNTVGSGFQWHIQTAAATQSSAMTLDSSGNLLVGTTSTDPVGTRVAGSVIRANGGFASRTSVSNRDLSISATSGSIVNFYSDNGSAIVYAGSINVNGNVTSYSSVSDYRLKENVVPMSNALADVIALNPVTYTFKDGGQVSQGFIAHELQAVMPECVTGTKDAVDADGNPQYQGIDTSFLVATLTAALQEAHGLIKNLEQRVVALEAV